MHPSHQTHMCGRSTYRESASQASLSLIFSGQLPVDLGIPTLKLKNPPGSNPPKSSDRGLAVLTDIDHT